MLVRDPKHQVGDGRHYEQQHDRRHETNDGDQHRRSPLGGPAPERIPARLTHIVAQRREGAAQVGPPAPQPLPACARWAISSTK